MKIPCASVALLAGVSLLFCSCVVPSGGYGTFSYSTNGYSSSVAWTDASYDANGFPIFGYSYGRPVYGYTAAGAAIFTVGALTALCFVPRWRPAPWYHGPWHYPSHIHRVAVPPRFPHGHAPGSRPHGGLNAPIHRHPSSVLRPRPGRPGVPGMGNHRPGHQPGVPGMGNNRPGHQPGVPGMGNHRPGHQPGVSGMGNHRPGHQPGAPGVGSHRPGHQPGVPGIGNHRPGHQPGVPGMGNHRPGHQPGVPGVGNHRPGHQPRVPGVGNHRPTPRPSLPSPSAARPSLGGGAAAVPRPSFGGARPMGGGHPAGGGHRR